MCWMQSKIHSLYSFINLCKIIVFFFNLEILGIATWHKEIQIQVSSLLNIVYYRMFVSRMKHLFNFLPLYLITCINFRTRISNHVSYAIFFVSKDVIRYSQNSMCTMLYEITCMCLILNFIRSYVYRKI